MDWEADTEIFLSVLFHVQAVLVKLQAKDELGMSCLGKKIL